MYCPKCGEKVQDGEKYCRHCGSDLEIKEEVVKKTYCVSNKNRQVALILALMGLIGIGGAHRFYVGKYISGVIYLITFGLFGIGTIYDIYNIYYESFKDVDGYPLYKPSSIKDEYKVRVPKTNLSFVKIIIIVILLFLGVGIMNYVMISQKMDSNNQVVTNTTPKDEEKILKQLEEIKKEYKEKQYETAEKEFLQLKEKYPNSKHIKAFDEDYGDLHQKAEESKEKTNERRKKAIKTFNDAMSERDENSIYAGCEMSDDLVMGVIYVNDYWVALDKVSKITFVKNVVALAQESNLKYFKYVFVKRRSNKVVAEYSKDNISIEE